MILYENNVMMWFLDIWSLEFKGTLDPFRLSSLDNWFTLRLAANLNLKEHVNSIQVHQVQFNKRSIIFFTKSGSTGLGLNVKRWLRADIYIQRK